MEIHLAGGDVYGVVLLMAKARAPRGQRKKTEQEQWWEIGSEAPDGTDEWDLKLREHSQWRSS
jgi:hypothetical protein